MLRHLFIAASACVWATCAASQTPPETSPPAATASAGRDAGRAPQPSADAEIAPEHLTLARQVVAALAQDAVFDDIISNLLPILQAQLQADANFRPEWREPFLQAAREEFQASRPAFLDATARSYARRLNPTELRDLLAFLQKPSGRAFAERQVAIGRDGGAAGEAIGVSMLPGVMERFGRILRERNLPGAPPPPTPSSRRT